MRLRPDPERQSANHSKRAAAAPPSKLAVRSDEVVGTRSSTKQIPTSTSTQQLANLPFGLPPSRYQPWLGFALLSIATFICYVPCLNGQFVWDDDAWTIHLEKLLRDLSGLEVIWTRLTALQQYYPLTAT